MHTTDTRTEMNRCSTALVVLSLTATAALAIVAGLLGGIVAALLGTPMAGAIAVGGSSFTASMMIGLAIVKLVIRR
ncbi:hypothetical protein [Nocardia coubleae]|uniref:Uncharacterized protein n=1 Tax=Nocardia coubleae TaxID=356147 RepID=A0A846W6D7_9NOCA|nr:hypothetical protein [Nocardia coubleae]NKX88177.1 hypothetical protein [Nocardia coubleae]